MVSGALMEALPDLAGELRMGRRTDELLPALRDAGAFALLQPGSRGGREAAWPEFVSATREAASACPAAGWLIATCGVNAALVARMPQAAHERVWLANPRPVIAAAGQPVESRAVETKEGYRVTGRWENVIAGASSDWVLASVQFDGRPCVVLIPSSRLEVHEAEAHVLRGSECAHLHADGIEVHPDFLVAVSDLMAAQPQSERRNRLYGDDFSMHYRAARLGALVGAAEGAYREYVNITEKWVSGIGGHQVAKFTQVQVRLAETNAELAVAALLLDQSTAVLQDCIENGRPPGGRERAELRRNNAYAARKSLECTERLVVQMGARGLLDSNPVQHFFVDIRAMAAHESMEWASNMSAMGKSLLGLETDFAPAPVSLYAGG
ncbi:MAG: acyl-CoA dehydrogenase family protein [Gammaproteobacteria bacterium]|nr:acyl-CoA dehydrogenase family protein [Gammaproteobacteria bacterium]